MPLRAGWLSFKAPRGWSPMKQQWITLCATHGGLSMLAACRAIRGGPPPRHSWTAFAMICR
eukprot:8389090-Alexandrium_andersonii.AAC.1